MSRITVSDAPRHRAPTQTDPVAQTAATTLAAPVTLAPAPAGARDRGERAVETERDLRSGDPTRESRASNDLRRALPQAAKRSLVESLRAASARAPRRLGLIGLGVLGAVIAAVSLAVWLHTSGSVGPHPSARSQRHESLRADTIKATSFRGQDPRASELGKPPRPHVSAHAGARLRTAATAAKPVRHRPKHARTATTGSAPADVTTEPPASTYQPAETSSTPTFTPTTTPAPAPTPTSPPPPTSGGSSSSSGGPSSGGSATSSGGSTSSGGKTRNFGPTGALGPGGSPYG